MEHTLTLHVLTWSLVGLGLAFMFIPEVIAEHKIGHGDDLPPTNLSVEQVGDALMISWEYDNESIDVKSWELKRKATTGGSSKIKEKVLDPDKKIKNPLDSTIQIDYVLDTSVIVGESYEYQVDVSFINDKKASSIFSDPFLVEEWQSEVFRINANQIETSSLIPLIDLSGIFNVLFIDYFPIIPYAYAPNPIPILTTELNPIVPESYLFSLEPIPLPANYTSDDCTEIMTIDYKRSDDFGQMIYILLTIFENNTSVHSHLFDATDSDKRIFNSEFKIPLEEQSITDYEDLELQIDIQAQTVLDSVDYRQLSIHGIKFQVPSDDTAC